MSDSCNPLDCSPPGSSVHEDSPGKNTGVGCHALLQGVPPGDPPNLEIEPRSPSLQADSLPSEPLMHACSLEEKLKPRQHIKKQRHYFADKGPSSQNYGFSSSHVWMWELDYKESWVPKNWCFWTVVLEKALENPLDCKEIQPVNLKEKTFQWCWDRLKAGEGDNRGWDGWMASPTQWTWVWANSRSWWFTGKAGVL